MRSLTLISLLFFLGCGVTRDAAFYFDSGKAELLNKNEYEAIRLLSRAIKLKPDFYTAYSYRASALMSIDSIPRAISDYDTLIKYARAQDELASLFILKGNALYLSSHDNLACIYYQKARDLNNQQAWDKIRKLCK